MQTARDVMQTHVVTLSPDTPLSAAQRVFYEESIHGAPVVDQLGTVVGVLTTGDLLRAAVESEDVAPSRPSYYRNDLDLSHFDWERAPADLEERLGGATVADAMSPEVIDVSPDTKVPEIARRMREHQIHRIIVVEDGKLCGLISTFDLIGVLAQG